VNISHLFYEIVRRLKLHSVLLFKWRLKKRGSKRVIVPSLLCRPKIADICPDKAVAYGGGHKKIKRRDFLI
jgi:hypothetical protein